MNLSVNPSDVELASFVTPGWLKWVAEVPINEIPAMVLEDPSVVTALVGALRHARSVAAHLRAERDEARADLVRAMQTIEAAAATLTYNGDREQLEQLGEIDP